MAKLLDDSVLDAALDKIATCDNLTFCSSQPANYAGIAAVALVSVVVDSGDFTKADHTTGRKITVAAQTGVTPSATGTVTYAVLDDGTTLLAATPVTSQAVTSGVNCDTSSFEIRLPDPS